MIARLWPFLLFLLLATLLAVGVAMSGRENREAIPSPLIGRPAPDFVLPTLYDPETTVSLADLRGEPFLLNVWASWCPACQDEHPNIERLAAAGKIKVVGFNWKDEPEDAMRWLARFGDPYHLVVADYPGKTAIDWGVYAAPETFLVDAKGIVRWKHIGPITPKVVAEDLAPKLKELGVEL